MKKSYTLCEHACPIKDQCARYLPDLDKSTTDHFAVDPFNYKKGTCGFFEPYDISELEEKINDFFKKKNN